ncbi:MAG: amino acid permease [Endomicrobium sp.]|jgi:L-asparagine transporter-like permease|nr:amino acid permease [Endomicrobium sp.]
MEQFKKSNLRRELQNRHIQFIAFGGTIGTGLFLGTSITVSLAGPSVIFSYLISGFIVFLLMRQLAEMITEEPVAGSFSHFAYKYWSNFSGLLSGWSYWFIQIISGIAALTSVSAYTLYWFPSIPTWKTALFFFVVVNTVSFLTIKAYGEIEFWFSVVKVTAVCAMILVGIYILFMNSTLITGATIKNLWMPAIVGKHAGDSLFGGFFPYGVTGFITVIPMAIFAFDGLEYIGITAAETSNPKVTIPKATNQVVFRTLMLYVGSTFVLLSLYHWSNLHETDIPFVMIFDKIGFRYAAWSLNFIILTAALSVYNGCIYSSSRTLYGLALQNGAPKIFLKTTKKGIPIYSNILDGILTFLVVPLNYFITNWFEAFQIIVQFIVACILISWILITISHMKFKKQKKIENYKTIFPTPFYPYSSYLTLIFTIFIFITLIIKYFF